MTDGQSSAKAKAAIRGGLVLWGENGVIAGVHSLPDRKVGHILPSSSAGGRSEC